MLRVVFNNYICAAESAEELSYSRNGQSELGSQIVINGKKHRNVTVLIHSYLEPRLLYLPKERLEVTSSAIVVLTAFLDSPNLPKEGLSGLKGKFSWRDT